GDLRALAAMTGVRLTLPAMIWAAARTSSIEIIGKFTFERFQAKWIPVRRPETRQNWDPELCAVSEKRWKAPVWRGHDHAAIAGLTWPGRHRPYTMPSAP